MRSLGLFIQFLSSNAQDFIEERRSGNTDPRRGSFLSSNAQDFIEDYRAPRKPPLRIQFLSSNAQDFIEDTIFTISLPTMRHIPEQ